MTNSKNTKRALASSVLAMLVCVAMLIGSTFAWFTDSVSTGKNRIVAGSLDVDLVDGEGNSLEGTTLEFVKADGAEDEYILWEPGCTYNLPAVSVKNNGNLALKYRIVVNGIEGDEKLLEAIEFTAKLGEEAVKLDDYVGHLEKGETSAQPLVISGHMKETAGNEYKGLTAEGISITAIATQDTVESDSFNNQYDADAPLDSVPVATADELKAALAKGGNIAIVSDFTVDTTNHISKDITLDLNGHTITNNVESGRPFYIDTEGVTVTLNGMADGSAIVIPETNTTSYGFVDMQAKNVTLVVNGGTYIGNTDVGAFFRPRYNGWDITLNDVTATTNYQIIGSTSDGKLAVNGGYYTITDDNIYAGFYLQATQRDNSGDALISTFNNVKIETEKRLAVEVAGSTATFANCDFGNPTDRDDRVWLATNIAVDYMGNATIESGTYSGARGVYIYSSGGTITINGGTFTGTVADIQADKGEIILNGGTLTNNTAVANGTGKITDNR